ncbi:MAG: hypothetical protein ABI646_08085 [Acidobacteriota bacterium]
MPACFSQEPVPVLSSRWFRTVRPAAKPNVTASGPVKPVNPDEKFFQRKAREQRTDNPRDPYEDSIEGRSAAMDKAVQESRAPQPDDVNGYTYVADIRNDSGMTVDIIFWEYRFTEIANKANVVRRQFLCGVKLKHAERRELSVFSLLGPSDALDLKSLAKSTEKLFEEHVQINRIELADGNILQRNDWKYSDVKAAVERATSAPWGNEVCRAL